MEFGIPQEKSCLLLAIRELLGDPNWAHPMLLLFQDRERGGVTVNIPTIAKAVDLLFLESFRFYSYAGQNDTFFEAITPTGKRYFIHRLCKTLYSYIQPNGVTHAMCIPFHVVGCMHEKRQYMLLLDKRGVYSMGRPLKQTAP